MPRKPKSAVENNASDSSAASSSNGQANAAPAKKKPRPTSSSAKKEKGAAAKKPAAKKKPAKSSTRPTVEPSDEDIRMRAYFIAERRHRLSLPGDSNHDWIEARRQLIEEASKAP